MRQGHYKGEMPGAFSFRKALALLMEGVPPHRSFTDLKRPHSAVPEPQRPLRPDAADNGDWHPTRSSDPLPGGVDSARRTQAVPPTAMAPISAKACCHRSAGTANRARPRRKLRAPGGALCRRPLAGLCRRRAGRAQRAGVASTAHRDHQKSRAREVHHDVAGDLVMPADRDALGR